MEVVTGALPSVITKLGELLADEYNLHKGVKGEIDFLEREFHMMMAVLNKVSDTPPEKLDIQTKMWARDLRELSYDIEHNIDTLMMHVRGDESANKRQGVRKFIQKSVGLFEKAKIRRGIATKIGDLTRRIITIHERRLRYDVGLTTTTAAVDPRLLAQYTKAIELVGIDEPRDELIKILMEESGVPLQQGKIVSIVGFGGLGKTTLAIAVYEEIKGLFDCCAFVCVSQNPDLMMLFRGLLYDLDKNINVETLDEIQQLVDVVTEFLKTKRYLIIIDDIWDTSVWNVIRCALPDNDVGYIVITTTRNVDVAEKAGGAYKLKPLSNKNSRKLLYKRVFGDENNNDVEDIQKCPDEKLAEVSDRILKKCAGVPLAIITIASLLACKERSRMDWYDVYHSIGTGLECSLDVENMRKILSFSYYNMPSHLKTCLLYLSMFPADYGVERDRLIWMWIAEGFIRCGRQNKSLFEVGETYFSELINRSMIQPVYDMCGMVYGCRVHDMALDLICSLSSEENFVTILNGMDWMSPSSKIRRLSIQNGKEHNTIIQASISIMEQVRSVIVFPSAVDQIPSFGSLRYLCVLDLNDCDLSQGLSLKYHGSLFYLKYLALSNTRIVQLPEEVGNLQFLQTLSIKCNEIANLPSTIVQLKHLMCLQIDMDTRVPNGIANLTSLEELSQIGIYDSTDIEALCYLTELRALGIYCYIECMDSLVKSLEDCLFKLQKVQNLSIWVASSDSDCKLDVLVNPLPQHLCRLSLHGWFSTLPDWVNPSVFKNLSFISIAVIELQKENLEILGTLPALCYLNLKVDHENLGILRTFSVGPGLFKYLVSCVYWGFRGPVIYTQGAMPRLTSLRFTLHVRDMREIPGTSDAGYNLGLDNLLVLQDVSVLLRCGGASNEEAEEVKAALKHATKSHPNHPTIKLIGYEDTDV